MSFTRYFRTDFDGTQPNLIQLSRNGTISEPGTGKLTISCPISTNCYAWDTTNNSPLAHIGPPSLERKLMMAEARVTALVGSTTLDHLAYLMIQDPSNKNRWGYAGYHPENSNLYMQSNNNGTETSNNWGTYTGPSTTPHIWRIFWNPCDITLIDTEFGISLAANQYRAQFSPDDGSSWLTATATHSLSWDLTDVLIGLGFRNWDSYPSVSMEVDYLDIFVQDMESEQYDEDKDQKAGLEDVVAYPTAGGPPKPQAWSGFGVGQRVPGPIDQPTRNPGQRGPFDYAGLEDGPADFRQQGGPPQHQMPLNMTTEGQVGLGVRVPGAVDQPLEPGTQRGPFDYGGYEDGPLTFPVMPGPLDSSLMYYSGIIISSKQPFVDQGGRQDSNRDESSGYEDRAFTLINPTIDMMVGYPDGDGHDFLGGFDIEFLRILDISAEPFGNPTPTNHYWGAAKDGKWYADGLATLQGDFGATGLNHRSWIFSNHYPQSASDDYEDVQWLGSGHVGLSTVSGPLPAGASWKTVCRLNSVYRWALVGDFDVEVEYLNFSKVASGSTQFEGYMSAHARNGNSSTRIGIVIRTDNVRRLRADTNSWNVETVTAPTAGKLRLTRTGSTVEFFYDIGSGWVSYGTRDVSGNIETAPVFIQFHSAGYEAADGTLEFQHFTINSGTISYDVGWALEAAGADRGNLGPMPSRLLAVGTKTSLDLIDPDTSLLWMRFKRADNNILDQWNTNLRPMGVSWNKAGVLQIAYGEPEGSDGAAIFVSFNSGFTSLRRTAGSTITSGAYYNSARYVMLGDIIERNNGRDWSGDDDTLAIPSNSCHDADAFCPDDPLLVGSSRVYYAIANELGVQVQTYPHWGPTESPRKIAASTETDRMRFCKFDQATGDLYYIDSTKVYQVTRATLDIGINGGFTYTFTANYSKLLPGTRSYWSQYTMTRFSTFIFVPADEGVYKIDWPTGSFVLEYGAPGSGAVHEILPEGRATEVLYTQDGTNDLLLVGIATEADGQLVSIRMNNHSIWAKTETFPSGRFVTGVAV